MLRIMLYSNIIRGKSRKQRQDAVRSEEDIMEARTYAY